MVKLKNYDSFSELTDKNMDLFLKNNRKCIVLCWKEKCPYCDQIFPILQSIALEMNDISYAQINLRKNRKITRKFNIRTVPTILVFHDNKYKKSIVGLKSEMALKQDFHLAFAFSF
jgi:thioredoxin 1